MKRILIFITIALFLISFVFAQSMTSKTVENTNGSEKNSFCGTSTYGECETNSDCARAGCSDSVCQSINEETVITTCEFKDCYNAEKYNMRCKCINGQCQWQQNTTQKFVKRELTQEQIRNILKERNRIRVETNEEECPEGCTCTGSVTKCQLEKGGREMTITAGKSGNTIFQVKNANASTKVELYKSDRKVYGTFKGNNTKEIRALPDSVKERIRERVQTRLQNEEIKLEEDGNYQYQARKRMRLLGFIPVKAKIRAQVDAETGEIERFKRPWWSFMARNYGEDMMVEGTCGTTAPESRDECCQNKGFDFFDSEQGICDFSE